MEQLIELITREDIDQLSQSEGLSFDDDRIAILESMQSIDVQACPGSGKTTLIAAKLMLLAKKWPLSGQGICVLSHTNVAKDEIIERLKQSKTPEAQELLSYPHFIGTIQEFVGKFLAFPCLRSNQIDINHVDTDACVDLIASKISPATKAYVDRKSQFSNLLYDFDLKYEDGVLSFNVPTFNGESTSNSYKDLKNVRAQLIKNGHLFYRDVFTFAQIALAKNTNLSSIVQKRFPFVFIDEMQDTQKFQDELLQQTFPLDNESVIVQRFGDPDQAIFHGISNEESNESFNEKQADDMNFVVNKSHRFDEALASKIKSLSVNQITLSSELSDEALADRSNACSQEDGFQHSVIVFDGDTIGAVVKSFADIVSEQFQGEYKASKRFTVKIVGAVGNEIDPSQDQLKIGHYWATYDKNKANNSLKATSLIDVVRNARQASTLDFSENYKVLIDAIIKWLILSEKLDENGRRFTARSLQKFLKEADKWVCFRNYVYSLLINKTSLTQGHWEDICNELKAIFELQDLPDKARQYLNYSENINSDENIGVSPSEGMVSLSENKIRHPDGFDIHLSTIHGVKGETHDATLILETKNHCFDLEAMLPYITNDLPNNDHPHTSLPDKPHHSRRFKPNKLFSRQLYVAASRPKHLLCIAMHASRINDEQKQALTGLGWKIISISQEGGAV